jgi:hypothetical protein
MKRETGRDYWEDWVRGLEEDRPLPRPWTELTDAEVDLLVRSTLQVKSFAEFKRKFLGFLEMIFSQENVSREDDAFVAYNENSRRLDFYKKIAKYK